MQLFKLELESISSNFTYTRLQEPVTQSLAAQNRKEGMKQGSKPVCEAHADKG
jgi:hypothetical protein